MNTWFEVCDLRSLPIRVSASHWRFVSAICIGVAALGGGCGFPPPTSMEAVPGTVPDFTAAKFANPTMIDNPYFTLPVGSTRTYMSITDEGTERIVIGVLNDTREVMGVTCRVVRDRVFLDDVLIEDTHDWFAQDDIGNVWYMGEEVDNYNYDMDGGLIDITHEGAWEAGKDVAGLGTLARPGYQMKAAPMPGDVYHQEYYPGEAEDMGEVIALTAPVTLADGTEYQCLQTRDFSALDSGPGEFKYYAPGFGVILEESAEGGSRVELVSVEP